MAADESLRRLGGGRWETKDGRFAIEPQSGTWAVVDNNQTNELGLPLVRGPFPTLTAAKDAINSARSGGPAQSPLEERIRESGREKPRPSMKDGQGAKGARPKESAEPTEPPEPRWIRDLSPSRRRRAHELIERLESAGVDDAEAVARGEIVDGEPAVARVAIESALERAIRSARSPRGAARAAVEALIEGGDDELDVRWRVVDGDGRRIEKVDVPD